MIPDTVVDRVREEADLVGIVGEFVKLKRVGNSFRGPCPFHHGKHDNFSVSARGGYKCFVCGESGDVFTFVEKHLGMDFVEAVKWVGAKAGVEVQEVRRTSEERDAREPLWEVNASAAAFFADQLWTSPAAAGARDYIAARGLSREDAERFSLGYAPRDAAAMRDHLHALGFDDDRQLAAGVLVRTEDRPEPRARFRDRLIFPILDAGGHVAGFGGRVLGDGEPKYLNSAESEIFSKRNLLYALNWAKQAARKADRLIVVEGYFDAIRLMLAGIQEVVAPLGTALTESQAQLLRKYTKNVFLLYDSDRAGLKATFRAGDALLANGMSVRVITLPDGEDPDTFVMKVGADGFERAAAASVDVFDRKIQILERGGWFTDLRRKRQALDKLLPTIRVTADPLMRDLYAARTSEVSGVSRDLVHRELQRDQARASRVSRAAAPPDEAPRDASSDDAGADRRRTSERRRAGPSSPTALTERELLRILLQVRRLVEPVAERIAADAFRVPEYREIFDALVDAGPDASVEEVAGRLDATATAALQDLLEHAGGLDRADEVAEASVNRFLAAAYRREQDDIEAQLPLALDAEKDELIRRKAAIRRQLQDLKQQPWKVY